MAQQADRQITLKKSVKKKDKTIGKSNGGKHWKKALKLIAPPWASFLLPQGAIKRILKKNLNPPIAGVPAQKKNNKWETPGGVQDQKKEKRNESPHGGFKTKKRMKNESPQIQD